MDSLLKFKSNGHCIESEEVAQLAKAFDSAHITMFFFLGMKNLVINMRHMIL